MRTNTDQQSALSSQPAGGAERHVAAHGRGFTLTEVMIVIAIIAILAVVVAWAGSRVLNDAKVKQTRAVMEAINTAITEYRLVRTTQPPQPYDTDDKPTPTDPGVTLLPAGSDKFRMDFFREPSGTPGDYTVEGAGDQVAVGKPDSSLPANKLAPGEIAYSVTPDPSAKGKYTPDGKRIYGIQSLYYYLVRESGSKRALEKVPKACLGRGSYVDSSGKQVPCSVAGEMGFENAGALMATGHYDDTALPTRVTEVQILLDAWGRPLYYGWRSGVNNDQPYVQSAGPDGRFDNEDDVFSFGSK